MKRGEEKYLRIFEDGKYFDLLQLSDAKLSTDDGCMFDIHKIVLAMYSEYFRAMFCRQGKNRVQFKIPGITGDCLGDILSCIYTEVLDVSEENIGDFLIATDYLLLSDLYMQIKQTINDSLTTNNCFRIYQAANEISDEDISQQSFRFIQTHFERVTRNQMDILPELGADVLQPILSNRSLCVSSESTVWQVIVHWTLRDFEHRAVWVPHFLPCMATKEIEENLAADILKHEIVSKNPHVPRIDFPSECVTSQDRLSFLIRNCSDETSESFDYRIPSRIFFVFSRVCRNGVQENNWYVSYDENVDVWRKVSAAPINITVDIDTQFLPVKRNIYILNLWENMLSFDLSSMEWVPMENPTYGDMRRFAVTLGDFIYVFSDILYEYETLNVDVYDTTRKSWFKGVSCRNVYLPCAVAYDEKIYLAGLNPASVNRMVAQVFDPATLQWSHIRPPNVNHFLCNFTAHNHKLYLIDRGYTPLPAEVYDPATNLWKQLPDMPYSDRWEKKVAVVLNDRLVVYERNTDAVGVDREAVFWNDRDECWENLRSTDENFFPDNFCSIDDRETLKIITKQNRDFNAQYVKKCFNG